MHLSLLFDRRPEDAAFLEELETLEKANQNYRFIPTIAGPPGMVKGLHAMLNESGVDDDDVRAEEFGGY